MELYIGQLIKDGTRIGAAQTIQKETTRRNVQIDMSFTQYMLEMEKQGSTLMDVRREIGEDVEFVLVLERSKHE